MVYTRIGYIPRMDEYFIAYEKDTLIYAHNNPCKATVFVGRQVMGFDRLGLERKFSLEHWRFLRYNGRCIGRFANTKKTRLS